MQSEEDWDDGEDWDDDYDDSESSSFLDMELATKMKIAGAVGIALLIILSSTIFTNFGFYPANERFPKMVNFQLFKKCYFWGSDINNFI